MKYIWDTNILLNFIRQTDDFFAWNDTYKFQDETTRVYMSIVSIGEIYSIAHQRNWQKRKRQRLREALEFVKKPLPIATKNIVEAYSRIDAYSQGKLVGNPLPKGMSSRNMGKNDIWIAATASVLDLKVVTTDNDFKHLQDVFLEVINL